MEEKVINETIEINNNSSLDEIINEKKKRKFINKKLDTKGTIRFFLSNKDDKYKLTNAKNKEEFYFDNFYQSVNKFIEESDKLEEKNIPSRLWLYNEGSFRATLTSSMLKTLIEDKSINEESTKLDISDEKLNEVIAKEEKVVTIINKCYDEDMNNEIVLADKVYKKEQKVKKTMTVLKTITGLSLVSLLILTIAYVIKLFV